MWSDPEAVTVAVSTLAAPLLAGIDNPEMADSFTVSWSAVPGAATYILEESNNQYFVDSVEVYSDIGTMTTLNNRSGGKLYYRVRAATATDQSPWSNTVFTTVKSEIFLPLVLKNLVSAPDLPTDFPSVADACVLEGRSKTNYGYTSDMLVGYDEYYEPDAKTARSYVRFDLSEIPNGTSIQKATLYLYLSGSYDFPGETRTIKIYRAGSSWSEMSVTWNSQPTIREAYGAASVTHGQSRYYAFDATGLVQGWVNGAFPNYGMVIRGPEVAGNDSSWKAFFTREGAYPPYLNISYSAAASQEMPSALMSNPTPEGPSMMDLFIAQPSTEKEYLRSGDSE
jgi:hypothetical protein